MSDPLAFRSDVHPGRVASRTVRDVVPLAYNAAPLQESIVRRLLQGPAIVTELVEAAYGCAPARPEASIRKAVHLLRRRLFPGWHIEVESRYVLVKR